MSQAAPVNGNPIAIIVEQQWMIKALQQRCIGLQQALIAVTGEMEKLKAEGNDAAEVKEEIGDAS